MACRAEHHVDRAAPGTVTALLYHHIVPAAGRAAAEPLDVSIDQFREHLLSIPRPAVGEKGMSPAPGRLMLTFDDARTSAWVAADLLEEAGWRGYFFAPVSYLGDRAHLSRRQVAALAGRGHVIGSHSMTHPTRMSQLHDSALRLEWQQSVSELAQITGQCIRCASVPGGDESPRVVRAAHEAGITQLFTSRPTGRVRCLEGCIVIGRYTVTRRSSTRMVAAIMRRETAARAMAWCGWQSRQLGKRLLGRPRARNRW